MNRIFVFVYSGKESGRISQGKGVGRFERREATVDGLAEVRLHRSVGSLICQFVGLSLCQAVISLARWLVRYIMAGRFVDWLVSWLVEF